VQVSRAALPALVGVHALMLRPDRRHSVHEVSEAVVSCGVWQRVTVTVRATAAPSEPINPAGVSVAAAAAAGRGGTSDSSVWLCSSIARVRSKIELYSMQCCRKSCRSPASWKTCRPSRLKADVLKH